MAIYLLSLIFSSFFLPFSFSLLEGSRFSVPSVCIFCTSRRCEHVGLFLYDLSNSTLSCQFLILFLVISFLQLSPYPLVFHAISPFLVLFLLYLIFLFFSDPLQLLFLSSHLLEGNNTIDFSYGIIDSHGNLNRFASFLEIFQTVFH